ncbi:hypothetical protein FPFC_050730 [Fructobacillus pseudoficulneus]|uniref:DUF5776 domain-containing protein n=1 Tax=Fructobacillus pseudoficulneus TaxID=220714 RepID=A0A3F3GX70_9LACO|nr:hypothetical protein [Fructobacillus pseudoficulneus]GAP03256.1 hypothetical protein FPFC_050730 [Fructobacillus pseudoficulneus]SEH43063.1 hypothetical protein SAMN05660469_1016 [Fructobacillus pseudoficulneus]
MNAYFDKNNNYQGIKSVQQSTTGSAYYQQGFNDVVFQAAQGIAYVQNGYQYVSVLTGNTNTSTGGNVASGVNTIRLASDIDLTGAGNTENNLNVSTNTSTFTIDGQNHLMDTHGNGYIIGGSLSNLYVQNFQTIYGYNYFGPFRGQNGSTVHFGNLNYVGPQLLSSYNNDAYFFGNVNVVAPINNNASYTSPFQSNVVVEGNGNQENLEVKNLVLQAGAHYFGATAYVSGGTNIVVQGNLTMDVGSKMTLVSRGNGTGATSPDSSSFGIYLQNGGDLNIKKNATLNIIPASFKGNSQVLGGAVYADGSSSLNIDGGSLNFEGYQGTISFYNQPIDLKGQSSINVINGGLLQVLADSIPANVNGVSNNAKSFSGFINNNNSSATFNIGSKGSLNVGSTNSDSNTSTLYYGPININSVGGNHVIFTKPNSAPYFQTNGNGINAYSVAMTLQGQTKPTYFYNFVLKPNTMNYTATDFYGNTVNGTITGNVLDLANVPAVQIVGPLTKTTNADGSTKVTANIKVSNYNQIPGQKIYVGVGSNSGTASDYSGLNQVKGQNLASVDANGNATADPNVYTTSVSLPDGYSGGLFQVSYDLPTGSSVDSVGMRFHYGVNTVNTILTPKGYKTTVEAYSGASNNKVSRTTSGDVVSANGDTGLVAKGLQDAKADMQNQNTAAHDAEDFNTKTDPGYQASYESAKAGYQAFVNNPGQDYTKTDAYQNSDSPDAFKQGYEQAATAAAISDAQKNVTNQAAYNNTANTAYKQAHDDYTHAYQDELNNPGKTAPAGSSAAATQAYSDALGAATFVADEQAGTIKGSKYASLNSSQQAAYNDAYKGYQQAGSVKPTADNPDTNPSLAETAGFDYGQSLINGGYSKTRPTDADATAANHMNNLTAAQIGWDTAQAAIKTANANYKANPSSAEVTATDPSKLSTDSGTTGVKDVTFNQYVKFGAYTALKQQSDNGLNQYEEVGYTPAATTASYQAGLQAYKNNPSATTPAPTGISAQSDAGKAAFAKGYQAAQDAAAQGVQNFKNGTPNVTGTDDASQITNQASQDASNGFNDANGNKPAAYPNNPSYMAGYNAAKSAQQAAADDKAGNTSQQSGTPDSAEYTNAKTAYDAAIAAAKNGNTTPSTSSDPVYKQAYNQALNDIAAAKQAAITNAIANHGQADSNNTTYAGNPTIQQIAQQAYATAQKAYTDTVNGNAPTTPTADQSAAVTAATQALNYAKDAEAGNAATSTAQPTTTEKAVVDKQVADAQAAFNSDPGASDTLNSNDPLANSVYKQTMDTLKNKYQQGVNDAAQAQTEPSSDSSDSAANKGYQDFINGLNSKVNGPALTTPNTGETAGINAYNSFSKGYEAAEVTTSTPSTSTDPIQNKVQTAATKGFQDAQSGKTTDTSSWDPISKMAYDKAQSDYKNAQANGVQDFLTGQQVRGDNTYTGPNEKIGHDGAQNGYDTAEKGFAAGSSSTPLTDDEKNDKNFMAGYNAAQSAKLAEQDAENNNTSPTGSTDTTTNPDAASYANAKQAYADAVKAAAAASPIGSAAQSTANGPVYNAAYNKALADMNAASAAGIQAAQNGGSATPSAAYSNSDASKAAYIQGYNAVKNAENAGIQNFKNGTGHVNGTDAVSQATNDAYDKAQQGFTDGAAGTAATSNDPAYKAGHDAGDSTKQAIADSKSGTTTPATPADSAAYNDAKKAYADGAAAAAAAVKAGTTPTESQSNDPVYKAAYNQALADATAAQNNAIQDADNNHGKDPASTTTPTNAAQQSGSDTAAKDKAYADAQVDGTASSSTPTVSSDKQTAVANAIQAAKDAVAADPSASDTIPANSSLANDPLAAYTYTKAVDKAKSDYQKGIAEAKAGTQVPDTASDAEMKGAQDFTTGFNNGNGATNLTTPNAGQKAGIDAATSMNQGYEDAENNKDDSNVSDPIQKEAATYAKQAFTDYSAGGNPMSDAQVNALDPIAKAAYLKAKNAMQNGAANGAQEFLAGKAAPSANTVTGQAELAGYNAAQSGYEAAKAQAADPNNAPSAEQLNDPNFKAGYDAYNNGQKGYNDTTAPTSSDPQAEQDGYNGAAAGTAAGIAGQKADVSGKSKAYQDAYNKAYDQATNGYNAGYAAGLNSTTAPTDAQQKDPNYMKGYHAGQSAKQAVADEQNGATTPATTPSDQSTYDKAKQAYAQGVADATTAEKNGTTPAQSQSTDPVYQKAYNQALTDAAAAQAAAIKDADNNSAKDLDSTAKPYSTNPAVQALAKQAYADAQTGYKNVLNGSTATPANAAQKAGSDTATADKAYADAQVNGTASSSTPTTSSDKEDVVAQALKAAKDAVAANPGANDTLPADNPLANNPLAAYTYKQYVDKVTGAYRNGIAEAKAGTQVPDSASDAEKQGAQDFIAGFNNGNGATNIATPNAGQQAGIDAAKSVAQGVTDAKNNTDDTNASDPIQKEAATYEKQAYTDYSAGGTPLTDSQVNALDPIAKAAYLKAKADAATTGQNAFINGTGRPNDSTPAGAAAAAAYDKAKQGYEDAKSGQTSPNVDPNDPSYKAGEQAYTDSQTGYNSKSEPSADASQPTKDAYSGANNGAADAVAGKAVPSDLANKSQAYQDAYNKAYSQAQAGIAAAIANTTPTDAQKADPNYMAGYNAAKAAIQNGGQTFLNGQNRPDDSTPMGRAAAAGYDASKKGYEDAEAGRTPTADEVNNPAYQVGKKAYTTTTNTAQADALSGNGPQDANMNPVDKAAYDQAYKMTIDGFNDGNNGASEAFPNDPNYQKGYAAAQAIRALFNDKKNNTQTAVTDQADYDLAAKAYEQAVDDVKNGRPMSANDKNLVYVFAYQQAYEMLMKEKQTVTPTTTPAQVEPTAAVTTSKESGLPETRAYKNFAFDNGILAVIAVTIAGLFATAKRKKDEK